MRTLTLPVIGFLVLLSIARSVAAEPYVTAQVGYANVEWSRGAPLNGRLDDRGFGLGVDLGFGLGKVWGVELGAYGYESFDARGTPCAGGSICPNVVTEFGGNDVSIIKAALAPQFKIGEDLRLFATMGYYRATIDTNLALPDAKWRDRGAVLGVGARWYFPDPWSVSVQATRLDDNLQQVMFGVGWGLRRDRNGSDDDNDND
jgi:hypothetical protein